MDRLLLSCGVITAAFFIAMDVAAATLFYPGYDYAAQQVSELSAIGAPSRPFWMLMSYPYAALMIAFGAGVWSAAGGRSGLRVTAALIMLFAVTGLAWAQFAPMHMRATEFTGTDVAHIAFAVAAVLLILLFIGFGAAALGRSLRIYSAVTIAAVLAAGGIVGTQIPAIAAGEPTPWMGLLERVSIYGPLLWMAVFALALLRTRRGRRAVAA